MASGFLSGVAQGAESGAGIARQQARTQLAQEQEQAAQSEFQQKQAAAQHAQRVGDLSALSKVLNAQRYNAAINGNTQLANQYGAQAAAVNDVLYKTLLGTPQVRGAVDGYNQARQNAADLASGHKTLADMQPHEVHAMITHATGVPAHEFAAQPTQTAIQQAHDGVVAIPQDGGAAFLRAANKLYGGTLNGYVGQHLADGSTIKSAEFVAPVPGQQPGTFTPMLRFTAQTPDGRQAVQTLPLLSTQYSPQQEQLIHQTRVGDLLNHLHALSAAQAAMQHPDVQQAVTAGQAKSQAPDQLHAMAVANAPPMQTRHPEALASNLETYQQAHQQLAALGGSGTGRIVRVEDKAGNLRGFYVSNDPKAKPVEVTSEDPFFAQQQHDAHEKALASIWSTYHPDQKLISVTDLTGKQEAYAFDPKRGKVHKVDLPPGYQYAGSGAANQGLSPDSLKYMVAWAVDNGSVPPGVARSPRIARQFYDGMAQYGREHKQTAEQFGAMLIANKAITQAKNHFVTSATSGELSKITSAGGALVSHLGLIAQYEKALANGQMKAANAVSQEIARQLGSAAPQQFDTARDIASGELGKYLQAFDQGTREEFQKQLSAANSPEQVYGVVEAITDAMLAKMQTYDEQAKAVGEQRFFRQTLAPGLRHLYEQKYGGASGGLSTPTAGRPPEPDVPLKAGEHLVYSASRHQYGVRHADGSITPVGK